MPAVKDWIEAMIAHFKIKLNGADMKSDVDRVVRIRRAVTEAQKPRGITSGILL
jgi:hypothetical protein